MSELKKQNSDTAVESDPFWEMLQTVNYDASTPQERSRRLCEVLGQMTSKEVAYFYGRFQGSLAKGLTPEIRAVVEDLVRREITEDEHIAFLVEMLCLGRPRWLAMRQDPLSLLDIPSEAIDLERGAEFSKVFRAVVQEKCR